MAKPSKGATRCVAEERKPLPRWPLVMLAVAAGLAALGWLLGQLVEPANLPLTTIRIESPLKQLTQDDIRKAVRPYVKEGFMAVDVDEICKGLESLPWVASASVRREWPDILAVRVVEQQPITRWSNGGLLNGRGEVFVPADIQAWNSLPLLRGPLESEKAMIQEYQAMQGMLAPLGLRISHLTMNERRSWSLILQDGLQLRLGRRDMHTRLLRFVRVFAQVLKPKLEKIDSVDLRYTNGFAVRWREGIRAAA